MEKSNIDIEKIISVEQILGLNSPFNLKFVCCQNLTGPGIYFISFNSQVIYVGKYQPLNGDIFVDRWLRHIETITLRGYRVGFGESNNPEEKLRRLGEVIGNNSLRESLQHTYDHDLRRFRDTGVVTSKNRVRFADENWNEFN
ncbi:hypothetical protein QN374_17005, partial [Herbaspirillum sp. RTI4]